MSTRKWLANAFGIKVSSEKEITELISSLKPGETKVIVIAGSLKLITLSQDGKISIITKKDDDASSKEVIEIW